MAAMTSFTFEKTGVVPAPASNTAAYSWVAEAGTSLASGSPPRRGVGLRKPGQEKSRKSRQGGDVLGIGTVTLAKRILSR